MPDRPAPRPDAAVISRRALLSRGAVTGSALAIGAAAPAFATTPVASAASPAAGATAPAGAGPVTGPAAREALRLARVWPDVAGDLPADLDTTHRVHDDGSVEVVLWPGDLGLLSAAGARVEVLADDLVARDAALAATAGARPAALPLQPGETGGDYRRLADVEADLRGLAARHPGRARLLELPFTTAEGRRILGLEIAEDVHAVDGRPTFHVDGIHHAREWPAAEMAIMWAHDLLEGDGDPRLARVLADVRTTVVPVVNPDGFHHSREAAAETPGGTAEGVLLGGRGAYWRKNRRSATGPVAGEGLGLVEGAVGGRSPAAGADAYGVDPNRNYPFTWGRPGSSSADIHSQSHRGLEPLSEPESRGIAWLMTTRHITGSISHHTYAGEIIWPWADEMGEAPDAALYAGLGAAMGALNGYAARKYRTSEGTTPDAHYGTTAGIAFLYEHGTVAFHPPYAETIPAMYAANREAFLFAAEELALLPQRRSPRDGLPEVLLGPGGGRVLHHAVLTGRVVDASGAPVPGAELVTRKRVRSPLWLFGDGTAPDGRVDHEEVLEARSATGPDGRFAWHVNPSTRPHVQRDGGTEAYELSVLAPDGATGTARRVVVGRGEVLDLGDLVLG